MTMAEHENTSFDPNLFIANPDSEQRVTGGFSVEVDTQRLTEVLGRDNNLPILILVSGTSESGKSHLGKKFVADGAGHRLKIYKTISELIRSTPDLTNHTDAVEFSTHTESTPHERKFTVDHIVNEYSSVMRDTDVLVGIVETLKNPWLVEDLKSRDDIRVISMYVDGPLGVRVSREAEKTGRSYSEIEAETIDKDKYKASTGSERIRDISDIVVWNGGSVETYNTFVETLEGVLKDHVKNFSGQAADFS